MAIKLDYRTVHAYELEVVTVTRDERAGVPAPTPFSVVLEALRPHFVAGFEFGKGATSMELTDLKWLSADTVCLLLNRGDGRISDVTYRNRKSKARRHGDKKPEEDIEISSHVLITALDQSSKATVLMTMGAGIYMDRIVKLFQQIYDDSANANSIKKIKTRPLPIDAEDSAGRPITYKVNHRFSQIAHPSTFLSEIIKNNTINEVELVEKTTAAYDQSVPLATLKQKTLKVEVKKAVEDVGFFKKLVSVGRSNYDIDADGLRVSYRDKNKNNQSKWLEVSKLDQAFTRSFRVELETDHPQHQSKVSEEIIEKLRALEV